MSRLVALLTLLVAYEALAAAPVDPVLAARLAPELQVRQRARAAEILPPFAQPAGAALPAGSLALYDNAPTGDYDLERVDLEVYVDLGTNDLTVFSAVTVVSRHEALGQLDFAYGLPPILWVRLADDTPLDRQVTGSGALRVTPDHLLSLGERYTFLMGAKGSISCETSMVMSCDFATPITYLTYAGYFPQAPGNNDPFVGTLRLAVLPQYAAAATGTLVSIDEQEGAKVYTWDHTVPTTYFSFAVAPFVSVADDPSGIPITVWTLPEAQANAQAMIPVADDVLTTYGERFAPYPWQKLDIVEIGDSFGGGYGPLSTIFLLASIFDMPTDHPYSMVSSLVSHELGHQWWGNLLNVWSPDAVWLSEGFAEFSSCLYAEVAAGSRRQFATDGLMYQYQVPSDSDVPLTYYQVYMSPYYQSIVYDKGAMVLDMLRYELGDDAFFAAMQHHVATFSYAFVGNADFIASIEESTGQDLGWFWDQWLYGRGYPRFTVAAARTDQGVSLTVTQTGDEDPFRMTLPVRVLSAGAEPAITRVTVEGESTTVDVPLPADALLVSIDPDRRQLRRLALADPADATLDGQVNGLDVIRMASGMQRNLVHSTSQGDFFYPNSAYPDFLDLAYDGKIDDADWDAFAAAFSGTGATTGE